MSRRRGRANTGRAASLSTLESAVRCILDNAGAILTGGPTDIQPALDCLRGPDARRFVQLDQSSLGGNGIVSVATGLDSAELLSLRLEVGGDAAEALDFHDFKGCYVPHRAIMSKAPRCLAACLAAGANPNARDTENQKTPLHYVAICMLEKHREPDKVRPGGPLSYEEEMADVRTMLRELKARGADISLTDPHGDCAVVDAVENKEWQMAATLIEIFASEPHSQHRKIRFAPILRAVMAEETVARPSTGFVEEAVMQMMLLTLPGEQADTRHAWQGGRGLARFLATIARAWRPGGWGDESGKPGQHEPLQVAALTEAAFKRIAPLVLRWLCQEADAEAVRLGVRGQRPPLVHLALQEQENTFGLQMLLGAEVDLALPNEQGNTALYSALWRGRKDFTEQLLEHAPQEQLVRLLTHDDEEGLTALGGCTCYNRPEELPLLLRACERAGLGVSGLLERHAARTAHHWPVFAAVVEGRLPVLEQLLAAGLDPESPACREHVDPSEETNGLDMANLAQPSERTETLTLLMCAASTGNLRAVRLLLAAGADARCSPPGNRRFPDAVSMVLRGLQLEAPPELERPDAEIAALAEPWLRNWQQEALEGKCGAKLHDPPEPSGALTEWLEEWGGDAGVGERFQGLLLLLWHGAALAWRQVGELLALLDVSGEAEEEGLAGAALENFLYERAKRCGCCCLVGRWRRCECKRVWYCSRACQKRHWKTVHRRECPLGWQLGKKRPAK